MRKHRLSAQPEVKIGGVVGRKLKGRLEEVEEGYIVVKPRLIQKIGSGVPGKKSAI